MPTEGQGAATFLRAKASVVETDEIQQEETYATDETPHAHTYTHAPLSVDSCTNQVHPCHCRQNPGRVSTTAPRTPCPAALGAQTGDSGRPLQRRQPRRDPRHHAPEVSVSRDRKRHKAAQEGCLLPRVSTMDVDWTLDGTAAGTEPTWHGAVGCHPSSGRGIPLSAMVSGVATPRRGPEADRRGRAWPSRWWSSAALRGQGAQQSPADGLLWVSAHRSYDARTRTCLPGAERSEHSTCAPSAGPRRRGGRAGAGECCERTGRRYRRRSTRGGRCP